MTLNNQKPCIVQTPQGFSVSYKEKFLYSKYNPKKAICTTVENLQLLPGTLILCCSPVMPYGLKELSEKLPQDCLMLGIELEQELVDFINQNKDEFSNIKNFALLTKEECLALPLLLGKKNVKINSGFELPVPGTFRRVIRIDFSSGIQFNSSLYDQINYSCVNAVKTFWTNRITLTAFGRRYTQDLFRNLKNLCKSTPISAFIKKITLPIIILGAGESTDQGALEIKNNRENFFILCADTAAATLVKNGIVPDGVFVEEAQNIITKAFIGIAKYNIHIFAGLSSVPALSRIAKNKNISYFLTLYTQCNFLSELEEKSFIESTNAPFGSVGLTMLYYALLFRKSEDIPVYIYGLDFSYSAGKTHAKNTMAHISRLIANTKLIPVQNYAAAFCSNAQGFTAKNGKKMYTTQVLHSYSMILKNLFAYNSDIKNIFDSSESGIPLEIISKKPSANDYTTKDKLILSKENLSFKTNQINDLELFLENTKSDLNTLKNLLTGNTKLSSDKINEEIERLINKNDYLYLHFADAYKFSLNQSFLNRIRTEIDFFLKYL